MNSFKRCNSFSDNREASRTCQANGKQTRPCELSQDNPTTKGNVGVRDTTPRGDSIRLKTKFEAIDVLLQILLYQEELTVKEYTIDNIKIKVLVIEDTEF